MSEEKPQEEISEEQTTEALPYEETAPYGIKPREVYYMCLNCGYKISKSELEQYQTMMCPRCGYRVFVKIRAPSTIVAPRRVYAI
ncbi:MAG: DNA-directed RNA polymerase [Acidilobus sp.]